MLYQMTFDDIDSAISSPGSADGHMLSGLPAGPRSDPSGPAHALASLSASQAKAKGLLTSGTFGPRGSTSSTSFALTRFLASRLAEVTAKSGSTLFRLTWKPSATRSGWRFYLLRASVRRTAGIGYSSWPTPDHHHHGAISPESAALRISSHRNGGAKRSANLDDYAQLATWPTAKASDGEKGIRTAEGSAKEYERKGNGSDLPTIAGLASWPTPMSGSPGTEDYNEAGNTDYSRKVVSLCNWTTPSARGWKDTAGMSLESVNPDGSKRDRTDLLSRQALLAVSGEIANGSCATTQKAQGGGPLNPALSRYLQGYPVEWCVAAIKAHRQMKSTRKKRTKPGP